jgi:hypothetical protein
MLPQAVRSCLLKAAKSNRRSLDSLRSLGMTACEQGMVPLKRDCAEDDSVNKKGLRSPTLATKTGTWRGWGTPGVRRFASARERG